MANETKLPRLSHQQIADLLAGDWLASGPLRINRQLTLEDLSASLALVNARRVLQTIRDWEGAPVTSEGRFDSKCLDQLARQLWFGETGEHQASAWFPPDDLRESDVRPLALMRGALQLLGLLARDGDRLIITSEGAGFLSPERAGELYARLLRAYCRDLDHSALDFEVAIPVAWQYTPYALWALRQLPDRWWQVGTLLNTILPEEALAAKPTEDPQRRGVPVSVQELYMLRFLEPLLDFALLETKRFGQTSELVRRTPLFHRVLTFEFR